jgi:prolipoprotein diacylglyceryltransferase
MEFSLLARAAIAAAALWLMVRWEARRGNAAGCAVDIWDAALTAAVGGIIIGRLVAMATAGINPITNPAQIVLIRSGVSTVGASLGAIAVYAFFSRRTLIAALDAVAPAAMAAVAGWHAGCVATAECLGTESGLPWAMPLEGSSVGRHPVELYTAIAIAVGAIAIAQWKAHRRPSPGLPAGIALTLTSGARLITEPLRISLGGGPVLWYGFGVIAGLGLIVWAVAVARRTEPRN